MNFDELVIRKAVPADVPAVQAFVASLSTASRASRFFAPVAELPPILALALAQADPQHHFLIARWTADRGAGARAGAGAGAGAGAAKGAGEGPIIALAQYARREHPFADCDIAMVIADAWQRCGLGRLLMHKLLTDARRQGLDQAIGDVLRQNRAMLRLANQTGFSLKRHPDDAMLVQITRPLGEPVMASQMLAAA